MFPGLIFVRQPIVQSKYLSWCMSWPLLRGVHHFPSNRNIHLLQCSFICQCPTSCSVSSLLCTIQELPRCSLRNKYKRLRLPDSVIKIGNCSNLNGFTYPINEITIISIKIRVSCLTFTSKTTRVLYWFAETMVKWESFKFLFTFHQQELECILALLLLPF